MDQEKKDGIANIAAIQINKDTSKYIDSVFYSMTLPWSYIPDNDQLHSYDKFYKAYYDSELVGLYETSVKMNKRSQNRGLKIRIHLAARMLIKGY